MESALTALLKGFRDAARSEREKGTYFEELIVRYLKEEPYFKDLYTNVWTYAVWANAQADPNRQIAFKRRHDFSVIGTDSSESSVAKPGSWTCS